MAIEVPALVRGRGARWQIWVLGFGFWVLDFGFSDSGWRSCQDRPPQDRPPQAVEAAAAAEVADAAAAAVVAATAFRLSCSVFMVF